MATDISNITEAAHTAEELLSGDSNILDQLIETFRHGLDMPIVYWQVFCVAAALGLGFVTTILLRNLVRKKQWVKRVENVLDETESGKTDELSEAAKKDLKRFTMAKLLLQLSWALFSMVFLFLFCFSARWLNLLPSHSLPIESIAWLICEAYFIVRLLVFIVHRAIPGVRFTAGLENFIAISIWSVVALQIVGALPKLVKVLETTKIPLGKAETSVWSLLMAVITIALALLVAKWIGQVIERWIWSLPKMPSNTRVVLIRILKIILTFIAILIGLSSVGIDITVLGVFGGAIGVGLGFGLQKIASNYVSGFIILLDRSIKIGDMVTVAGVQGIVAEINTRYTVIRQFNGSVTIIPNESFVVGNVTNTSYLQGPGRNQIEISVDYSSDVDAVIELMNRLMLEQPRVLRNPAPYTLLTEFADSGITLTAYFWVSDPENGTATLRSNLSRIFLKEFNRHGINIPFPQRELKILQMPDVICKVETAELSKKETEKSGSAS
jgi:small-conductance mechanosensitive channel